MRCETNTYRPGLIADAIALHMDYYARHWDFGAAFEAKLAHEMGEFHARFDPRSAMFATVHDDTGALTGTITMDAHPPTQRHAHLRWFIVDEALAGKGLGAELMRRAMDWCRDNRIERAWLTTFAGLDPARRLYERHGFALVSQSEQDQWQGGVVEQRFEAAPLESDSRREP